MKDVGGLTVAVGVLLCCTIALLPIGVIVMAVGGLMMFMGEGKS